MKKLILTSDNHLSDKYTFSDSTYPFHDTFFKNAYYGFREIIDYAAKNNCDILNAGDFFNDNIVHAPEYYAAVSIFKKLKSKNIKMILNSTGNHEIGYEQGMPTISNILASNFNNVFVNKLNHPWTNYNWNGLNIYLIPYSKEKIFEKVLYEMIKNGIEQPACLCIHQNIKGISLGNVTSVEGMDPMEICSISKKYFKFIVCGHIHHPFHSDKFGVPIFIPGSTVSVDFKDEGEAKSFYLIEFDKSYDINDIKTILLKNQIIFKTIQYEDVHKYIDFENYFFKVELETDKDFTEVQNKLKKAYRVIPKWKTVRKDHNTSYQRNIKMTLDEWLITYMEKKGYNGEEIQAARACNEGIFKG